MSAVTDQTEVPDAGQAQNTGDLDDDDGAGLVSNFINLDNLSSKREHISWIFIGRTEVCLMCFI